MNGDEADMGYISKPDDKTRRKMIEDALGDLDPNIREEVKRLIEELEGQDLEEKLRTLIGRRKTMELLENGKSRPSFPRVLFRSRKKGR